MKDLTAMILAGGLGTRLRPVVTDRPKVLVPVHGRPFLSYLLDQLVDAGVEAGVLCTGHLAGQVREAFGDHYRGMRLGYSVESVPLGTGGALRLALPVVETQTALVLNGDSFVAVDLAGFVEFHRRQKAAVSMVLTEVPNTQRYGRVQMDGRGNVHHFEEKGAHEGAGWVNAGVYLMKRSVLERIPAGRAVSLEREVLPDYLNHGLTGFCSTGRFLDIGTPQSYAAADEFFAHWPQA